MNLNCIFFLIKLCEMKGSPFYYCIQTICLIRCSSKTDYPVKIYCNNIYLCMRVKTEVLQKIYFIIDDNHKLLIKMWIIISFVDLVICVYNRIFAKANYHHFKAMKNTEVGTLQIHYLSSK